ncbi:MAG: AAA-associated domain-containing protein [Actinomycetia bacterium]|nr:AAA-associated domain-containing protein [Actinomycetes bacterium]
MKVDPLPQAKIGEIIGLLEILEDIEGKEDIHKIARQLNFDLENLAPIIDALELLELARISDGDIALTELGIKFLNSDVNDRKLIFKKQLKTLEVFKEAILILKGSDDNQIDRECFVETFSTHITDEDAEYLVNTVILWGRYAELIGYNSDSEEIYLDQI